MNALLPKYSIIFHNGQTTRSFLGIAVKVTRARSRRIAKSGAWRLDRQIQPEPVRLLP